MIWMLEEVRLHLVIDWVPVRKLIRELGIEV